VIEAVEGALKLLPSSADEDILDGDQTWRRGSAQARPCVGALKKSGQGSVYIYAPRSHVGIQERGYPGRIGEANLPLFLANPDGTTPKQR